MYHPRTAARHFGLGLTNHTQMFSRRPSLVLAWGGWRIRPSAHHTAVAPHHRVLAQSTLAFQSFGYHPLKNLQDHGLVLMPLRS